MTCSWTAKSPMEHDQQLGDLTSAHSQVDYGQAAYSLLLMIQQSLGNLDQVMRLFQKAQQLVSLLRPLLVTIARRQQLTSH